MPTRRSVLELEFQDQNTGICVDPEVTLADARLKRLYDWWLGVASRGFPMWNDRFLVELDFIDTLHLYEVFDGVRFQTRHVGHGLVRRVGRDTTGVWLSSEPGDLKDVAPSVFRAFEISKLTFQMKAPLRTFSKSSHALPAGRFKGESLWLPMSKSGSAVDYIFAATILTRVNAGPDPVQTRLSAA